MTRRTTIGLAVGLLVATMATAQPASADGPRPDTYQLEGDEGGSRFEGIGVDRHERTFYVSEVTGGEIHRGDVRTGETTEWMRAGADGRFTARGITTDRHDRIFIAGGPNGIGTDRPDLWVYDADGTLLAALRVGAENAFINDVTIGPDGAAYFTNSNAPQIFRVAEHGGDWHVTTWADATGTIATSPGFNLGGIVVSTDRSALVVAQGNVGKLWRFDLATATATPIALGGADVTDADGLVREGSHLMVVRNFSRVLTTLRVDAAGHQAHLVNEIATDPDRVFTTGKIARGRLLLIDSHFDEPIAQPPYEVVAVDLGHILGHR